MKRLEQIRARLQFQEDNAELPTLDRSATGETLQSDFHEAQDTFRRAGPATLVRM